jgi:hypothetical protein
MVMGVPGTHPYGESSYETKNTTNVCWGLNSVQVQHAFLHYRYLSWNPKEVTKLKIPVMNDKCKSKIQIESELSFFYVFSYNPMSTVLAT